MFALLLFPFITLIGVDAAMSPQIMTKTGPIRGQLTELSPTLQVYQFLGIPFAEPPIGDLRFKKPAAKLPWTRTLDAVKRPNACIQPQNFFGSDVTTMIPSVDFSEDCLFLNIWVPKKAIDQAPSSEQRKLSVMTYIHGGAFIGESSMEPVFNGSVLSGYNNVIIATIQYRLGSLGFLYYGNENAPGNMGLWDQLEAIKWISENIGSFGGNGSDVLIFGQSAGAASVALHLLSPKSRPFFQKAIIQSASALSPWAVRSPTEALKRSNMLPQLVNATSCKERDPACLLSLDASVFSAVELVFPLLKGLGFGFVPVVDGDFLPRDPLAMLKKGDFHKGPMMFGFTREEGSFVLATNPQTAALLLDPSRSIDQVTNKDWQTLLNGGFTLTSDAPPLRIPQLMDLISSHYAPKESSSPNGADLVKAAVDVSGDYAISCPTANFAGLVANVTSSSATIPMFGYFFTHRSPGSKMPDWMGTMHGDELAYVFGQPLSTTGSAHGNSNYYCGDTALSRLMMAYWTNFAKFGDPNVQDETTEVLQLSDGPIYLPTWPVFNDDKNCVSGKYFEINADKEVYDQLNPATICRLKADDCNFWLNEVPKMAERYDTATAKY